MDSPARSRIWQKPGLRLILLAVPLVLGVLALLAHGPIAQPQSYHNFAGDQHAFLGVPRAANVLSNIPFILVGILGMFSLRTQSAQGRFRTQAEIFPFALFHIGIFATGFGSAYYHWDPADGPLVWDRLPIAASFMALFAAVLGERLGQKVGTVALGPLVALGIGSVILWHSTEDLRLYFLVQGYPLLAIPLLLLLYPPAYTKGADYVFAILWYALAKALETGDSHVYQLLGETVSGHTLKHLASGVGAWWIVHMLQTRVPLPTAPTVPPG